MYYPYLRGKMYELVAVRELIEKNLIDSKYVSPIIEPVRDNSTFNNLLIKANANNYKLNIISNPMVGDYKEIAKLRNLIRDNNMRNGVIVSNDSVTALTNDDLLFYKAPVSVVQTQEQKDRTINIVPDNTVYKFKIGKLPYRVLFADCFNKMNRNVDYIKKVDEDFSLYHLIYKDEGYKGFGDYSIIGEDYSDSGFAPYAVAIHIVYFDNNDALRVHHFVSESNDDMFDPANKLMEALTKLHGWMNSSDFNKEKNESFGLKQLDTLFVEDRYPGLGFLKKLEIMHHLEIMNKYLGKVENAN